MCGVTMSSAERTYCSGRMGVDGAHDPGAHVILVFVPELGHRIHGIFSPESTKTVKVRGTPSESSKVIVNHLPPRSRLSGPCRVPSASSVSPCGRKSFFGIVGDGLQQLILALRAQGGPGQ